LTVTQDAGYVSPPPDTEATYTAAELLEVVLAAYERGLNDAASQDGRDHWNRPELIAGFREQRKAAEIRAMRERAASRYLVRGLTDGYDYKGGPVDFETGMPLGSACAWLRRQRARPAYELAGGDQ
jgi:hypothetical protein